MFVGGLVGCCIDAPRFSRPLLSSPPPPSSDHLRTLERYVADADRRIAARKRERQQEDGLLAIDNYTPYASEDSTPALKDMCGRITELEARVDEMLLAGQLNEADALKMELEALLRARAEEHARVLMEVATLAAGGSSGAQAAAPASAPAPAPAPAANPAPAPAPAPTEAAPAEAAPAPAEATPAAPAATPAAAPAPAPATTTATTPAPPPPSSLSLMDVGQGTRQRLRVCAVCGSQWSLNDASSRVAEHLSGRHHLGLVAIRRRVACVREYLRLVALLRTVPGATTAGFDPSFDYVKAAEAVTPEMVAAAKAAPFVDRGSGLSGGSSSAGGGGDAYAAGASAASRGRSRSRDRGYGGRDSYYSGGGRDRYGGGGYDRDRGYDRRDRDAGYDRRDRDRGYDRSRDSYYDDHRDRDRGRDRYYDDDRGRGGYDRGRDDRRW